MEYSTYSKTLMSTKEILIFLVLYCRTLNEIVKSSPPKETLVDKLLADYDRHQGSV